jgi:methionyl-tRNA synthetase
MTAKMGVPNDDWIRTTEPRHKASCAELWRRIAANGHIYLGDYEGWYAVRDEAFYDEAELTTRLDGTKTAPSGARSPGSASRPTSSISPNGRTSCWTSTKPRRRNGPTLRAEPQSQGMRRTCHPRVDGV